MTQGDTKETMKLLSDLVLKSEDDFIFAQMHNFVRYHLNACRSDMTGSFIVLRPDNDVPELDKTYLSFLQLQKLIMDLDALDRGIVSACVDDAREKIIEAIRRERMPLVHLTTFTSDADEMILKCKERLDSSWQLNLSMSVAGLIGRALATQSNPKNYVN